MLEKLGLFLEILKLALIHIENNPIEIHTGLERFVGEGLNVLENQSVKIFSCLLKVTKHCVYAAFVVSPTPWIRPRRGTACDKEETCQNRDS